jgi:ABC-type phosphate/phosphonate transport system ATPase subunit
MPDPRFPILGPAVPPMIGRTALMADVWQKLTKTTPSHLAIVGPRFAGKSVFLTQLATRARAQGSSYTAAGLASEKWRVPREQ